MSAQIAQRKDAHLDLCLDADVEVATAAGPLGLGSYTLEYDALPEVDLDQVTLETEILGKRLAAPLIIGAMTGGTDRARRINHRLARAAARVGVGMGLGSQRAMIANPELTPTYAVREAAPDLPLLTGNVGAVQLRCGVSAEQIASAVAAVDADALMFHLNPLQEAIQPEGDTCFAGLLDLLAEAIPRLGVPALVKEVGSGISPRTAAKLAGLPLAGVEVAGVGGTSWARVESRRAPEESAAAEVGRRLGGWGVPTAASVGGGRAAFGPRDARLVIASGGIRHGMDVAVALALGADAVALARPLLVAADQGEDAVVRAIETLLFELRVICFCTGVRHPRELRAVTVLRAGDTAGRHVGGRDVGGHETGVEPQ